MRKFLVSYRLPDGRRGVLHVLAADSCAATARVLDSLGHRCCGLSVRPVALGGLGR